MDIYNLLSLLQNKTQTVKRHLRLSQGWLWQWLWSTVRRTGFTCRKDGAEKCNNNNYFLFEVLSSLSRYIFSGWCERQHPLSSVLPLSISVAKSTPYTISSTHNLYKPDSFSFPLFLLLGLNPHFPSNTSNLRPSLPTTKQVTHRITSHGPGKISGGSSMSAPQEIATRVLYPSSSFLLMTIAPLKSSLESFRTVCHFVHGNEAHDPGWVTGESQWVISKIHSSPC